MTTKFFAKLGVDYGKTGWVTDKGEFIECDSFEHDLIAEKLTGKNIDDVEKIWVRISVMGGQNYIQFNGDKINKKQIKALDDWGLMDFVERKRVLMTIQFINAYFND